MQILIVDDDDFALSVLDDTLGRMGYTVVAARNGVEAMEHLRRGEIRLVVTDWDMPEMNGVDLCRTIRREDLSGYVYVIMLTGREGAKQRMEGLCAGADDFLNKPLDPEEMLVCLKTAERILSLETRDVALFALAKLAESRDSETGTHIERVQSYARLIAQHLSQEVKACYGVDEDYIRLLYQTSPLHDLGKVGIPDAILLKPGKLTPDEFAVMKNHTIIGAQTLDAALRRFPNARFLQIARNIAATHHEKFDGSGYPQGLAGEQIPLCGRIVAVADVYDALTSRRVYKEAMTHEQAKAILLRDRGSHFDPEMVDAFMRAETQILAVRERLLLEDAAAAVTVQQQQQLQLQVPQAVMTPAPLPPPTPGQRMSERGKILVVEDDPILLHKLTELLGATGETIFSATDGDEATKILEEHAPRVVVSDWVMPRMDGVQLCRYIRNRDNALYVHFIMLTAHTDKSRLLDAYEAGIDDFVSKPFDCEELLARVRAGLRAANLHDELVRKATGSQALNAQLATLNSRLERLSITDELTGLFNRRHAMIRLEEAWALVDQFARPLTVAMIDIDHFKKVNDAHGHDGGDVILRRVANLLRDQTRGIDAVCRVGGEEFLVIFPSQTQEEIEVWAERCREAIQEHEFNIRGGVSLEVTVSIGLATRTRSMPQFTDLLKASDEALYEAKHGGRNIVRVAAMSCPVEQMAPAPVTVAAAPIAISLEVTTPDVDAAILERPVVDMEALLKRCGNDASFAKAVIDRFRAQAGLEVEKVAVAMAAGDLDTLCRSAHSLKSMSAYVAADAASDLARQIESNGHAKAIDALPALVSSLRIEIDRATKWLADETRADVARCA